MAVRKKERGWNISSNYNEPGRRGSIVKQSVSLPLQHKGKVMVFGWSMSMPLPFRLRRYDDNLWEELLARAGGKRSAKEINGELGFFRLKYKGHW